MEEHKIIFFPFAGGNLNSFNSLSKALKKKMNVECYGIEYPGRGGRSEEPLLTDMEDVVNNVYLKYSSLFMGKFCFFGYSMGAIVAYLLCKKLKYEKKNTPEFMFIAACPAPRFVSKQEVKVSLLSNGDFLNKIIEYGGIHTDLLKYPDFLKYLTPIIKSDYAAYESFKYVDAGPIDIPIHVLCGSEDHIPYHKALSWKEETLVGFSIKTLNGGHFFLHNNIESLADLIFMDFCKVNSLSNK